MTSNEAQQIVGYLMIRQGFSGERIKKLLLELMNAKPGTPYRRTRMNEETPLIRK